MTPSEIKPETFRLVAQHLEQLRHGVLRTAVMVKTNTYNGRYHFSSAQLTASENALSM
jgi:hypothetical protein